VKKEFSRDTIIALVILALFVLVVPLLVIGRSAKKELDTLKTKQKEIASLGREYRTLKESVDSVEQRPSLSQIRGVANALDSVSSSLGIKAKIKSVKAVSNREIQGSMSEESAEVLIEKVTLNELVNLLYKINDAPMILSVKRVTMKKSFENPELLDLTMTIALFTRK
jgi:general secretion pathway protein M